MGRLYTVSFTDQQLQDLIDALPYKRPTPKSGISSSTVARAERQWNLHDDLQRIQSKGPDRGIAKPGEVS